MQEYVFEVWHVYDDYPNSNREDIKFMGVYSTLEKAKAVVQRVAELPGFTDYLDGFIISQCKLGRDGWVGGFVSLPAGIVPAWAIPYIENEEL